MGRVFMVLGIAGAGDMKKAGRVGGKSISKRSPPWPW
jgi:Na+/H+-dicarboxylate symporter